MLSRERFTAIIVTLFVWGLAGALFGALFIALTQVLAVVGLSGWRPLVLAAMGAAMTTAAFYSAMPVAAVGATAGVLASIAYLILSGPQIELPVISTATAVTGAVAGSFYAWMIRRSARALAKTLTGMLAGLGAGLALALLLSLYPEPLGSFVLAAGVVALVGALFQLNEHWIVQACHGWLPDGLAAPLVAGLIAAVVGAGVWVVGGTTAAALDLETRSAIDQVLREVPAGLLGGLLGGSVTGLILELLGYRLEEQELG